MLGVELYLGQCVSFVSSKVLFAFGRDGFG